MSVLTHSRRAWQARLWWPWLLGAAATVLAGRLSWAASGLHGLGGFAFTMVLLLAVYGGAAVLARIHASGPAAAIAAVFFLGIPVGLVVDAVLDRMAGGSQREMFPYEVAIWSAYAALPVAVGVVLGGWWRSRRSHAAAPIATAPALWNPLAAALWSLLLTPVFGGLLHIQNWRALGRPDKARQGVFWVAASALVMAGGYALSPEAGLLLLDGILLLWLVFPAREQVVYVRRHIGREYPRRSWVEAAALAIALMASLLLLAFALAPLRAQ